MTASVSGALRKGRHSSATSRSSRHLWQRVALRCRRRWLRLRERRVVAAFLDGTHGLGLWRVIPRLPPHGKVPHALVGRLPEGHGAVRVPRHDPAVLTAAAVERALANVRVVAQTEQAAAEQQRPVVEPALPRQHEPRGHLPRLDQHVAAHRRRAVLLAGEVRNPVHELAGGRELDVHLDGLDEAAERHDVRLLAVAGDEGARRDAGEPAARHGAGEAVAVGQLPRLEVARPPAAEVPVDVGAQALRLVLRDVQVVRHGRQNVHLQRHRRLPAAVRDGRAGQREGVLVEAGDVLPVGRPGGAVAREGDGFLAFQLLGGLLRGLLGGLVRAGGEDTVHQAAPLQHAVLVPDLDHHGALRGEVDREAVPDERGVGQLALVDEVDGEVHVLVVDGRDGGLEHARAVHDPVPLHLHHGVGGVGVGVGGGEARATDDPHDQVLAAVVELRYQGRAGYGLRRPRLEVLEEVDRAALHAAADVALDGAAEHVAGPERQLLQHPADQRQLLHRLQRHDARAEQHRRLREEPAAAHAEDLGGKGGVAQLPQRPLEAEGPRGRPVGLLRRVGAAAAPRLAHAGRHRDLHGLGELAQGRRQLRGHGEPPVLEDEEKVKHLFQQQKQGHLLHWEAPLRSLGDGGGVLLPPRPAPAAGLCRGVLGGHVQVEGDGEVGVAVDDFLEVHVVLRVERVDAQSVRFPQLYLDHVVLQLPVRQRQSALVPDEHGVLELLVFSGLQREVRRVHCDVAESACPRYAFVHVLDADAVEEALLCVLEVVNRRYVKHAIPRARERAPVGVGGWREPVVGAHGLQFPPVGVVVGIFRLRLCGHRRAVALKVIWVF
ncbi:phenylalanine 4-monooxygenase [Babesia caballi]|uniref:Phenylalanine 4-monooxygenase n=1 Tax=Babesia caballi TaxID=5871 RepID=A0AAV4LUT8_BABCB|nr:phenylalanine 4-monooxygenase [Babesia caballi]